MPVEETAEVDTQEAPAGDTIEVEVDVPEADATPEPTDGDTDEGAEVTGDDEDVSLLDPAEEEALKDDPAALKKALLRSFSEKTTKAKAARREAENAIKFVEWMNQDPHRALHALASKLGVQIPKDPSQEQAAQVAKTAQDEVMAGLVEAVGEDAAQRLLPIMQTVVKATVDRALVPVRTFHQQEAVRIANERASSVTSAFKSAHPDFPKYEDAMVKLAKKFPPAEGVEDSEWMEGLYIMAKTKAGTQVGEAAARMAKSAASMRSPAKGQSSADVSTAGSERPDINEAFAMAARGIKR